MFAKLLYVEILLGSAKAPVVFLALISIYKSWTGLEKIKKYCVVDKIRVLVIHKILSKRARLRPLSTAQAVLFQQIRILSGSVPKSLMYRARN